MSKFPVRTQRPWFELPLKPSPFSKKKKKSKERKKGSWPRKGTKGTYQVSLFGLDHQFA
jgi:hypothetical protein